MKMTHGTSPVPTNEWLVPGGQWTKSHALSARSSSSIKSRHSPARTRKSSCADSRWYRPPDWPGCRTPIVKPTCGKETLSPSRTKASPRTSFVIQRPSRTFTTNQPSVAGARPPSVSSRRASSTIRRLDRREPLGRSGASPFGFDLAILRRCRRHELLDQPFRSRGNLVDSAGESCLVRLRRLREAADLPHVLERGIADLLVRGGWF